MDTIDFDKLIDYFEEKVSPEEQALIDNRIEQDAEFANWVEECFKAWIENPESYREELKALQTDMYSYLDKEVINKSEKAKVVDLKSRKRRRQVLYYFGAAAAVAGLIFTAIQFFPSSTGAFNCATQDTDCLLAATTGIHQEQITTGSVLPNDLSAALAYYKEGDYQRATATIPALLDQDYNPRIKEELRLLLGISHLKLKAPVQALPHFATLINDQSRLSGDAQWYTALAYLQQNNEVQAIRLLDNLIKDQDSKFAAAAEKVKSLL